MPQECCLFIHSIYLTVSFQLKNEGFKNLHIMKYADLISDPLGKVNEMYKHFGLTMSETARSAMQQYLINDPKKTKYGEHKYSMEQYGLTLERIAEDFSEYIELAKELTGDQNIL